ncbi:unnamed protein product [Gongylonema pulchrum]|uniref:Uncharacterized protein n=1 Tax=Gongylonema pulchrum TaxID=637853 RepID=A0A3P6RE35_9BILA|nr:unnamed protein product [Gongylonema pulchrum]
MNIAVKCVLNEIVDEVAGDKVDERRRRKRARPTKESTAVEGKQWRPSKRLQKFLKDLESDENVTQPPAKTQKRNSPGNAAEVQRKRRKPSKTDKGETESSFIGDSSSTSTSTSLHYGEFNFDFEE